MKPMKNPKKNNVIILLGLFILSLSSCNEFLTKEEHNNILSEVSKTQGLKNDSIEKMFVATIDEIDGNLDAIRMKQGLIIINPMSNSDISISKKEKILNNIAMINELLETNKSKVLALEKNLSKYKSGKKELLHSIEIAKGKVAAQEKQIEDMKIMLTEKDFKIDELNKTLSERQVEIDSLSSKNKQQEHKLNKTFFAYGTYKQLREKHIIEKEGGLLGIGRVKAVSKNLNNKEFSEMDMFKTTSIELEGKKPKIITKHPNGTFKLERKSDELALLTINDPENFWKISKYLIVEVH